MKRFTTLLLAAFVLSIAAPAFAAGPFKDVPKGHWAYKAVEQAVEAGILQGYDGKFHGGKTLTRYQMAIVVSRMLNRIETSPSGKYGKKDIENLEALVIEFADELALLNVKVSTLEDAFQAMKKDVDAMKAAHDSKDQHAGISGMLQTRLVMTDEDPNATFGKGAMAIDPLANATPFARNYFAAAATPTVIAGGPVRSGATAVAGNVVAASNVAGTLPVTRYVAGVGAANATNTVKGQSRTFFNVAQASLGFDRHFDDDFYLHLQADIDADNETGYVQSIQINEAYVDMEKFVADGDVRVRVGTWALPFSRERNPEMVEYPNQLRYGYRTLDLTLSPTMADAGWDSIRSPGAALWNGKQSAFQYQIGAVNNPNDRVFGAGLGGVDGSLMAARQNAAYQALPGITPAARSLGAVGNSGLYGDAPATVSNNDAAAGQQDALGFYAWAGDKYAGGFRWDAGFFTNGGELNPTGSALGTQSSWSGYQVNAGWWGWENWGFMGSFYGASSDTFTPTAGSAVGMVGGASNFTTLGLYPVAGLAATHKYPNVDSTSASALVNYKFSDDNNVTARYEMIEDKLGAAKLAATILTLGWNHRISQNSLLQLEYLHPESESTTAAVGTGTAAGGNGIAAGTVGALSKNSTDVNDDLIQLNYKVRF